MEVLRLPLSGGLSMNHPGVPLGAARGVLLFLLLVGWAASPARAQEVSAGITGIVTDPSGASVVAAEVTATDLDRGLSYTTHSNEAGNYALPRVQAGRYEVRVQAEGFRGWVQPEIILEVNQRARIDVVLELGSVSETVEVSAAGPLLQTEKTELGAVITGEQTVDLPLPTRNFISMTLLVPGVTTTNPSSFNNGRRSGGNGRPYVNGNREQANNFLLDGVDNNQVTGNLTAYQPNIDAIAEFKVITNNASAEFGNFQGGVINVTLKSGSNQLHGSLFEFIQNDKLNANDWARNWQAASNPAVDRPVPIRQNMFGFTLGGPAIKDKLFFFVDYQGTRRSEPGAASLLNVMPTDFRQGDFSNLLDPDYLAANSVAGGPIQLYDYASVDANGRRQPFVNNMIPMSRIDPVAANLLADASLYPGPVNGGLRQNQLNTVNRKLLNDQGDAKLDWRPTDSDTVSARYSKGVQDDPTLNTFPLTFNTFNNSPFQAGVVNWTRTFGASVVNELRLGVNNIMIHNGGTDNGLGDVAQQLGIKNGNDRGPGLMQLQFAGSTFASNVGSANIGTQSMSANTTYHYADNLTIIRGRHQMKMGGQALRQQMNTFYAGNTGRTGFLQYNGNFTRDQAVSASRGLAEADFLLGTPVRIGRGIDGAIWGHRKWVLGFYFQDDWRATDELTLNLGLRWEWHQPLYEVRDRQSNFEPYTGALLLAGQNGNSRALYNPYNKGYQPRIGFAYTPKKLKGKTVFRGAYTISSFMEGTGTNLRLPLNPPFNVEFEAIYDNFTQPGSLTEDGFSTVTQTNPYQSANIRLWDPNVRPSTVNQWNFTVEQQLAAQTVLTVGYVGQKGTHLVVPMPYFQRVNVDGTPAACRCSPYLSGNPDLKVISQISGTESNGDQEYNALQATLRRRMARGLLFQAAYTWQKGMSDAIGYYGSGGLSAPQSAYWQNLRDKRAEWGPTYFNQKQTLVANFVYQLPIGKGHTIGGNWSKPLDVAFGGWQVSGILSAKAGFPWTISGVDRSGTVARSARADRIGDGNDGPHTVGQGGSWFDKSAFSDTAVGTFGNSGVGVVFGPRYSTLDASVEKSFQVKEGQRLQFRTGFINLTNSPIFQAGNRSVTSPTFGEITSAQGARIVQFGLRYEF
ncbi:MAG: TonB-dependent receptor plug domain-containing protein [Acidobacteria bacterium]|nr:TonB-dependent receptor plug domain-containing protein [Acidobacteriota bacterium]